jgi:hypothetical protein
MENLVINGLGKKIRIFLLNYVQEIIKNIELELI